MTPKSARRSRLGSVDTLADRLYLASIHLIRRLRREDEQLTLSPPQLSALSLLVKRGAMTLSALAQAEGVRAPTITRLAQRLEAGGYVVRKTSPDDARVSLLEATHRAWIALEEGRAHRVAALRGNLESLDRSELRKLEEAIGLIERVVEQE